MIKKTEIKQALNELMEREKAVCSRHRTELAVQEFTTRLIFYCHTEGIKLVSKMLSQLKESKQG